MSHLVAGALTGWALFVYRRGRFFLCLLALASIVAAVAAARLFSLDSDVGKLIKPSPDNVWHEQNEAFKQAFPQAGDSALVVISGAGAAEVDEATDRLVEAFSASNWYHSVSAPGRDPFMAEHLLYQLELDQLQALVEGLQALQPILLRLDRDPQLATYLELTRQALAAAGSAPQTAGQQLLVHQLQTALATGQPVSWLDLPEDDSTLRYQLIVLKGRLDFGESTPSRAVVKATRDTISRVAPDFPRLSIRLTGELAMADEELQTALQGIQFAGLLSLGLLALILTLGVRSWSIVLVTFLLLGAGVGWTSLFASLVVGSFNTLSLVFLVMFFGLGVDFALHYCLRIEEAESTPAEARAPLSHATRDIGTALLLCTATTGVAFIAFLPTEYRGLADLGVISAGGMVIAFILTLTLVPAWFAVFGMPQPWQPGNTRHMHFGVDQLPPLTVLLITTAAALGAGWFAKDARFDYSVLAMRDPGSEAISTLLELQRANIGTDYSVSVLAEPEQVEELTARFLALPSVAAVRTPGSVVPPQQPNKQRLLQSLAPLTRLHLQLAKTPDTQRTLAAAAGLAADLRQLGQRQGTDSARLTSAAAGLERLQSPEDVEQLQRALLAPLFDQIVTLQPRLAAAPYGLADLPAAIRARLIAPDGRHRMDVLPRETLDSPEALERFVSEVEKISPNIAGRAVVERGVGQAVVRSFHQAVAVAIAGIVVILLLYFREPLTPLLVLIPLGLTTLFTFAVIEVSGLTLNMANILVVPLIFGLGVDTGVHVVHRYHCARNLTEVLRSSTPRAVVLSALTTIGTFFSLSFSPHLGAASIGLILSVAITLLVVVTFIVLPALLALFEPLSRWGARGGRGDPGEDRGPADGS